MITAIIEMGKLYGMLHKLNLQKNAKQIISP